MVSLIIKSVDIFPRCSEVNWVVVCIVGNRCSGVADV